MHKEEVFFFFYYFGFSIWFWMEEGLATTALKLALLEEGREKKKKQVKKIQVHSRGIWHRFDCSPPLEDPRRTKDLEG